jgi:hypothetical protein
MINNKAMPVLLSARRLATHHRSSTPTVNDFAGALRYADGKVTGDTGRVHVKLGSTVALVVTSAVADKVHLHGYDKKNDVPANGTATLTFTATIPGVFEVELEKLSKTLVMLEVS